MNNFTPEQIEQFLEEFFNVVGRRQYIGARYVPIFGRKDESSIEWDNTKPYEPLTIVLYQGNSYTSRTYVPAGIAITDTTYWANTGNYNAQVEEYRQDVVQYYNNIAQLVSGFAQDTETCEILIDGFVESLYSYCVVIKIPKSRYELSGTYPYASAKSVIKNSNGYACAFNVSGGYVSNGTVVSATRGTGWGYLAQDANGDFSWIEDYAMLLNAPDIFNYGYVNGICSFGPLVLNGTKYDFAQIPETAPERDYVLNTLNPRSVFGWDSENMYICFVDGRTPFSTGTDLTSLQNFIYGLGIQNAVNMDGGGSTQLWICPYEYNMMHIRAPESPYYSKPNNTRSKAITLFRKVS